MLVCVGSDLGEIALLVGFQPLVGSKVILQNFLL